MSDNTYVLRLKPGDDLKEGIQQFVNANNIHAGWIVTCVGSLTKYHLRFANQEQGIEGTGHFEIVSLTGTLSVSGSHLHASISDEYGHTTGGHLLSGCTVYTTAEIVLTASGKFIFTREHDEATGWKELKIKET